MLYRILVAFLLLTVLATADDAAVPWSKPVSDLRGRLVIPAHQESQGGPFIRVYLELQNTLNVLSDRKFRYAEKCFVPQVKDELGTELPKASNPYDGWSIDHESLVLPFDSTLRFLINGHGMGVMPGTRQILDFGPMYCWIIPQSDGHSYFLSGRLTLPGVFGENAAKNWSGVLDLPGVQIPRD